MIKEAKTFSFNSYDIDNMENQRSAKPDNQQVLKTIYAGFNVLIKNLTNEDWNVHLNSSYSLPIFSINNFRFFHIVYSIIKEY